MKFGLHFVWIAAIASMATAQPRDWTQHPAIVETKLPVDLYALGDVHGDYERMVELLVAGQLIEKVPSSPDAVEWIGGHAMLICTGDFIDKYGHALEVIELFRALQPQAEKAGGRFVVLLGNHEAEFLGSDGNAKKSVEFSTELKAAGLTPADVVAGRDAAGIGAWMRNLPVAAKVEDWFFCHAGNTGGRSLDQLQNELQSGITSDGFAAAILSNPNSLLEARLHPRQWWDAAGDVELKSSATTPSTPAMANSEKRLRAVVEPLGCKHLVVAHQPGQIIFADGSQRDAGKMLTKFNGLIFLIDTGMSRGVNIGDAALLKIHSDDRDHVAATAVFTSNKPELLWSSCGNHFN